MAFVVAVAAVAAVAGVLESAAAVVVVFAVAAVALQYDAAVVVAVAAGVSEEKGMTSTAPSHNPDYYQCDCCCWCPFERWEI